MKVYNEDKTKELLREDCDLTKGYFSEVFYEKVYRDAIEEIPEEGHYEVIAEYPNGGKDLEWIIDTPKIEGREGFVEEIPYQYYIPFSQKELIDMKKEDLIKKIKKDLDESDYIIIRFLEGSTSKDRYIKKKAQRERWRELINKIEKSEDYNELLTLEQDYEKNLMV